MLWGLPPWVLSGYLLGALLAAGRGTKNFTTTTRREKETNGESEYRGPSNLRSHVTPGVSASILRLG